MKYGTAVDGFVRARWAGWLLATLDRAGLTEQNLADALRTNPDDRDTAKRSAVKGWLNGERTISPERAFDVGNTLSRANIASSVDGIIALHAAGYLAQAMSCVDAVITAALDDYEVRTAPDGDAVGYPKRDAYKRIEYALRCAAGLPVAHANLDGVDDTLITPGYRYRVSSVIAEFSNSKICENAWKNHASVMSRWADLFNWSHKRSDHLGGSSARAWAAFVDSISIRARDDQRLTWHWKNKRGWFDKYRAAAFGGEPMQFEDL